jgi:corrinoid protein of di/trimethylamine methyltransferase
MANKEELLSKLSECVVEMEDEEVVDVANEYLEGGYPAFDGIMEGLVDGMNKASDLYDAEEYFVTDVLLCSDAMYAGLDVLRPHLPAEETNTEKVKAVIGVVEGDTHDIGKNLVKIMMDTAGFEMYDLGRDVPLEAFVDKAVEVGASLICLSTLMTTTMPGMKTIIDMLEERGIRDNFRVMIGGSPISQKFADEIGADGYSKNAVEAVKLAQRLSSELATAKGGKAC